MTKFWIGVASEEHVILGVRGGFCQLNHGKSAPLTRMKKGDWLIYYSPKTSLQSAEKLQAFTAIGRVKDDRIYKISITENFSPYRRDIEYAAKAKAVFLKEISENPMWNQYHSRLRYGFFEISKTFFQFIAVKMGLDPDRIHINDAPEHAADGGRETNP